MHYQYQARPYQLDLIHKILACWSSGQAKRLALQLDTGAGKTVIFSEVSRHFMRGELSTLVITHREELILQAVEKLGAICGLAPGIIKSRYRPNPFCLIQVASIQSLSRRCPKKWPPASVVIIDECHHSCSPTYQKLFAHYTESYFLGVTATPLRLDGQGLQSLYERLIVGPPGAELVAQGYLSPCKLFASPTTIEVKKRQLSRNGDYSQKALNKAVDTGSVMGDVIDMWHQHAQGKKTLVFGVSVAHSKAIAQSFASVGIPAEHLDGDTPVSERRAILDRFRSGQTLILCNCGIVSEGFDVPDAEVMQCVRPTRSLALWLQMVGRIRRPAAGKEYAIVIDHTENWTLGMPDDLWFWSLEGARLTDKQYQKCPACGHVFEVFLKGDTWTCPNCQYTSELLKQKGRTKARLLQAENIELQEIAFDSTSDILHASTKLNDISEISKFIFDSFLTSFRIEDVEKMLKIQFGCYPEKVAYVSLVICEEILVFVKKHFIPDYVKLRLYQKIECEMLVYGKKNNEFTRKFFLERKLPSVLKKARKSYKHKPGALVFLKEGGYGTVGELDICTPLGRWFIKWKPWVADKYAYQNPYNERDIVVIANN